VVNSNCVSGIVALPAIGNENGTRAMPVFGQPARVVYGNYASGVLRAFLRRNGTGACRSAARLLTATMAGFDHREGVLHRGPKTAS
jgi:hypothetical protein